MVNNCCEFNKNPEFSSEYSSKGSFFGRNCFQISNISNLFYNVSSFFINAYRNVANFVKSFFESKPVSVEEVEEPNVRSDIKRTVEGFPITSPKVIGAVYQEMKYLHEILEEEGIRYWVEGGSILGIERHNGGMFSWDDDADIQIYPDDCDKIEELRNDATFQEKLRKNGFKIIDHWQGWKFVPLEMPEDGTECYSTSTNQGNGGSFFAPCIDLFKTKKEVVFDEEMGNDRVKITFVGKAEEVFKNSLFYEDELFDSATGEIPIVDFGPIKVRAPKNGCPYLFRYFGDNVFTHAYKTFSHLTGESLSEEEGRKEIVELTTLSQAEWKENRKISISL
jgi:hypothetical protein